MKAATEMWFNLPWLWWWISFIGLVGGILLSLAWRGGTFHQGMMISEFIVGMWIITAKDTNLRLACLAILAVLVLHHCVMTYHRRNQRCKVAQRRGE